MKELRIADLKLDNPFFLAPLAGITDAPTRRLCKEQGASLVFSEMVSGKGLWYGDKNTGKLLHTYEEEKPVAFQIFGHEPEIMASIAEQALANGAVMLDINMGCPVPKVAVKSQAGAALLKSPDKIREIVEAVVEAVPIPVTVKIRSGWDKNSINAVEIAGIVEDAGASAITVHPRTKDQGYSGKSDLLAVQRHKFLSSRSDTYLYRFHLSAIREGLILP